MFSSRKACFNNMCCCSGISLFGASFSNNCSHCLVYMPPVILVGQSVLVMSFILILYYFYCQKLWSFRMLLQIAVYGFKLTDQTLSRYMQFCSQHSENQLHLLEQLPRNLYLLLYLLVIVYRYGYVTSTFSLRR